jgi:hypothetical protein
MESSIESPRIVGGGVESSGRGLGRVFTYAMPVVVVVLVVVWLMPLMLTVVVMTVLVWVVREGVGDVVYARIGRWWLW